jgi:Na+/H+-dicarboxylate symporter
MSQASRVLTGLGLGLAVGTLWAWARWPGLDGAATVARLVGGIWLDALRMTIVPLVFALIVTGIAANVTADMTAASLVGRPGETAGNGG